MSAFRIVVALGCLVGLAAGADAHAIDLEVRLSAASVVVEVFYDDDSPAVGARVTVFDSDEHPVAEGRTDDRGAWTFPRPSPGVYRVVADAGDGHVGKKRFPLPSESPVDAVVSDGPTRVETTGVRRWYLSAIGLAAIALGTIALRQFARRRPARA